MCAIPKALSLSCPCLKQLLQDVPGFLRDKPAALGDMIKGTPCILFNRTTQHIQIIKCFKVNVNNVQVEATQRLEQPLNSDNLSSEMVFIAN